MQMDGRERDGEIGKRDLSKQIKCSAMQIRNTFNQRALDFSTPFDFPSECVSFEYDRASSLHVVSVPCRTSLERRKNKFASRESFVCLRTNSGGFGRMAARLNFSVATRNAISRAAQTEFPLVR